MSKDNNPRKVVNKVAWPISHKESSDGKRMDIIVSAFEKLEVVLMSISMDKATPANVVSIEAKIHEVLQRVQADYCKAPHEQLKLCVSINENTGAQEVYFSNKNGLHQLVVSSADFEA